MDFGKASSKSSEKLETGVAVPSPRTGHSAVVYNDAMYIFGGSSNENKKLNDTWSLNLITFQWTELCKD